MHCGHITDSSPLLKHKQGKIFNRILTQAGCFLFGASCPFRPVPMNNVYNGIIVDDLDQSISLIVLYKNYKTNKMLVNSLLRTYQVIFLNSFSPELATIYRVSAAPTTE